MKKLLKFFGIAILGLAFSANTFGQGASDIATASATIIGPIAISKTIDMNFGNIAVNDNPGTVVLAPAGTRTATGGITLPATAGTVTAASFTVTGVTGYTYSITLPSTATTISDGTNTMTVDTWTSNPTSPGTLTTGTATLTVGATLHVSGDQPAGVYSSETAGGSGPFTVRVDYN